MINEDYYKPCGLCGKPALNGNHNCEVKKPIDPQVAKIVLRHQAKPGPAVAPKVTRVK